MSDQFKALADPTRREILKLLDKKDMTAGEIADNFAMAHPSVTHHLNILKNAGLVTVEKNGQQRIYSLNMSVFEEVMEWFLSFSDFKKKNLEVNYEKNS